MAYMSVDQLGVQSPSLFLKHRLTFRAEVEIYVGTIFNITTNSILGISLTMY